MIRNKLNNLIGKKYFLVIFSIVTSLVLWMYVTYVENPQGTNSVSGIEIEYKGEEALKDNNLLITSTDKERLTIKFSGRRNSIAQLNSSNLTVTVDLEEIIEAGARTGVYQLSYEINYPQGFSPAFISVTDASADYITVTVAELVTVDVPVKAVFNGNVAPGYQAKTMEVLPDTISISGTDAVVSKVDCAKVVVDIKDLTETYEDEVEFTLVDKNGVAVDDSAITKERETVEVKIPVFMVKTVDLRVNFKYTNLITADNFDEHVKVTVSPENVTLSGDADILEGLNSLKIGEIDLSEFASTTKETFKIQIPNDVTNVTGVEEATVTVEISGFESLGYSVSNISVINETEGYTAKIETQSLFVRLRGSEDDLNEINSSNIRIVADLSELGKTTGTYSVLAKVYVDGYKYVDAVGDYYITVTISRA